MENKVAACPYSFKHFPETSPHVSAIANKSYALGSTTGHWPGPWEGGRGLLSPTPVLAQGITCQHVGEASLAGTAARSRGPGRVGVKQAGEKPPEPSPTWLLGDSHPQSRPESLSSPHTPCAHYHQAYPVDGWLDLWGSKEEMECAWQGKGVKAAFEGRGGKQCYPDHQSPIPKPFVFLILTVGGIPESAVFYRWQWVPYWGENVHFGAQLDSYNGSVFKELWDVHDFTHFEPQFSHL